MKMNAELRAQARSQLRGSWMPAVGVCCVYGLLVSVAGAFAAIPLLILGGPLTLGYEGYFLRKARGESAIIENLFDGFNNFGRSFVLFLLQGIFICLWSLLLVVPGIIKAFSYSMAFFILRDNPEMSGLDAITASKKMMKGYKGKLFCLCFSFIGWCFLCVLTCGIGYFWLGPYMQLSMANFYEDIKGVSKENSGQTETGQLAGCEVN